MASAGEKAAQWWVLAFSLPMQPAYARVKIWRHLQGVGAITLGKNAVYVLPAREDLLAAFQWVLGEARNVGGNAIILEARAIAGYDDREIQALFEQERESEYGALSEEIRALRASLAQRRGGPSAAEARGHVQRLAERARVIGLRDFFGGAARAQVASLLESIEGQLS